MSNKQFREWTHPRRILLATDLTDLGFTLPIAKQQALAYKAELRIIHVLPDPSASPLDPVLMVYFDAAGMQKSAETTLGKVIADTKAEGIKCSFHLATGHTVKEILAAATEWKADRVIAGSHGKAKFHHHILGQSRNRSSIKLISRCSPWAPKPFPATLPRWVLAHCLCRRARPWFQPHRGIRPKCGRKTLRRPYPAPRAAECRSRAPYHHLRARICQPHAGRSADDQASAQGSCFLRSRLWPASGRHSFLCKTSRRRHDSAGRIGTLRF